MSGRDLQDSELDATFEQLMTLPAKERIRLAERLIESVPAFATPEIEQAWTDEICRRIADFERGDVQDIPSEEVHAAIRQRLMKLGDAGSR